MAMVAAKTLLEEPAAYQGSCTSTKLKVTGVDLFSAGDFADGDGREEIVLRDAANGIYKRLVIQENRIIGTVMYGDTADGNWFFGQLKDGKDISGMRDTLIFGPGFQGGPPLDPMVAVAASQVDADTCSCNGEITKNNAWSGFESPVSLSQMDLAA
jgi:nitrite reductase (NADH) large subunit